MLVFSWILFIKVKTGMCQKNKCMLKLQMERRTRLLQIAVNRLSLLAMIKMQGIRVTEYMRPVSPAAAVKPLMRENSMRMKKHVKLKTL